LNQIDLTPFKDDLLDPNIDIEDFFDWYCNYCPCDICKYICK
jgi:hypothetical protein